MAVEFTDAGPAGPIAGKGVLCNKALARVGVTRFIEDIESEESTQAEVCRMFYDGARDQALREFPWPFATKYQALSLAASADDDPAPAWANDFDYAYHLPSDCIAVRRIITAMGHRDPNPPAFHVAEHGGGAVLLTDEDEVSIEYTRRVSEVTRFDAIFASAVSWLLAFEIALPLSVEPALRQAAYEGYRMELSRAAAKWGNEGQKHVEPDSPYIRERG